MNWLLANNETSTVVLQVNGLNGPQQFDAAPAPTTVVYRNGSVVAWTTTLTHVANGLYTLALTVPAAGLTDGQNVAVRVSGLVDTRPVARMLNAATFRVPAASGLTAQQAARIRYGVSGTVWHVAIGGSAANDGLSWETAFALPEDATAAADGDLILVGPGLFETSGPSPGAASVMGAGMDRTVLRAASGNGSPALSLSGPRVHVSDLTVLANASFEDFTINVAGGTVRFARMRTIGGIDGVVVQAGVDGVFLEDCSLEAYGFDAAGVANNIDALNALSPVWARRCRFRSRNTHAQSCRAVVAQAAVQLVDCELDAVSTSGFGQALRVFPAGTVRLDRCTLRAAGTDAANTFAIAGNPTAVPAIVLCDTAYDRDSVQPAADRFLHVVSHPPDFTATDRGNMTAGFLDILNRGGPGPWTTGSGSGGSGGSGGSSSNYERLVMVPGPALHVPSAP